jgi:hypothetical protein
MKSTLDFLRQPDRPATSVRAIDQHQKNPCETKHGFPIGPADRAEEDLPLSRYEEVAEAGPRKTCAVAPVALIFQVHAVAAGAAMA